MTTTTLVWDQSSLPRVLSGLPNLDDPTAALGMCVIDALNISPRLTKRQIPHVFVRLTGITYSGREHWAIAILTNPAPRNLTDLTLTTATVIDRTAHQFDPHLPSPHITDWDTWLDDLVEALNDGVRIELTRHPHQEDLTLWDRYERDDIDPFTPPHTATTS